MNNLDNCILTIFGASGDLAKRKLFPALLNHFQKGRLPKNFAVLGTGRSDYTDDSFREMMSLSLKEFGGSFSKDELNKFIKIIYYIRLDPYKGEQYSALVKRLSYLDKDNLYQGNILFYLSTPPALYSVIPTHLGEVGIAKQESGWRRLIVEKPFGTDSESAALLNGALKKYFLEEQIFRIDHYLGKETVQNVLVTRFANGIFEPLWNRNYISHVEITSSEDIGIGSRGQYYDGSGAIRDMIQNHLLQLTSLIALEPPSSFNPDAIRNETFKVFQSMRPFDKDNLDAQVVLGQYTASTIKGQKINSYRDEDGVSADSHTETFAALKIYIDNFRWGGVPFYIRTGKRLPTRVTEAVIHFKRTPHKLFKSCCGVEDNANLLIIRIQPDEGIVLKFGMKMPGAGFDVHGANLSFRYADLAETEMISSYERLLLDCIRGDSTLYTRIDSVLSCWDFVKPILKAKESKILPLHGYPAGTWGPEIAESLFDDSALSWRYPCRNLVNDGEFCEL